MAKKEIKNNNFLDDFNIEDEVIELKEPTYVETCDVNHDGLTVKIKNKNYILPSLSVRQYKNLSKSIEDFENWTVEKQVNFSLYLCYVSLKRNYSDIDPNWLEENLSPSKISKLIGYVMSGVKPEEVEEIEKKS